MHIAYSAIRNAATPANHASLTANSSNDLPEPLLRYIAYQAACQKLSHEIAAIQKYMPGWIPAFSR